MIYTEISQYGMEVRTILTQEPDATSEKTAMADLRPASPNDQTTRRTERDHAPQEHGQSRHHSRHPDLPRPRGLRCRLPRCDRCGLVVSTDRDGGHVGGTDNSDDEQSAHFVGPADIHNVERRHCTETRAAAPARNATGEHEPRAGAARWGRATHPVPE
jgi:hypothetical protein